MLQRCDLYGFVWELNDFCEKDPLPLLPRCILCCLPASQAVLKRFGCVSVCCGVPLRKKTGLETGKANPCRLRAKIFSRNGHFKMLQPLQMTISGTADSCFTLSQVNRLPNSTATARESLFSTSNSTFSLRHYGSWTVILPLSKSTP